MNDFCYRTANIWQLVGYVILVIKIVVPIIIIFLGIIDLAKAVISSDDKAISKSAMSMVKKMAVAIVIFFIPTLVDFCFSFIGGFSSVRGDYLKCSGCLTHPNDKCDTSYKGTIFKH